MKSLFGGCVGAVVLALVTLSPATAPVMASGWGMLGANADHNPISDTFPGRILDRLWRFETTSFAGDEQDCVVVRDGRVFTIARPTSAPTERRLYAVSAVDGAQLWVSDPLQVSDQASCPAADENRVYVSATNDVKAFDVTTGSTAWTRSLPTNSSDTPGATSPTTTGTAVYVGAESNGKLVALNASTGTVNWSVDSFRSFDPPLYSAGSVIVANYQNSTVMAVSAEDGTPRWWDSGNANPNTTAFSDVVADQGTVYIADFTYGTIEARDSVTGAVVWSRTLPGGLRPRSLAVSPDSVIIAAPCAAFCSVAPSKIIALARVDGQQQWSTSAVFPDQGLGLNNRGGNGNIWGDVALLGDTFVASTSAVNASSGASVGTLVGWPVNTDVDRFSHQAFAQGVVFAWVRGGGVKSLEAFDADVLAPDTTVSQSGGQVVLGSSEAESTFECRIDEDAWAGCVSPVTIPTVGLTVGDHVFFVRATDRAGNTDESPGSTAFIVPTPPVVSPPGPPGPPGTPPGGTLGPIPPAGARGVSINDGALYTNSPNVTISVVWPLGARSMVISNDGGFGNADTREVSAKTEWTLRSSGSERLPKTLYLRFDSAGDQTFQDDIILDETPPVISSAVVTQPAIARLTAKSRTYPVKVKASDKTSGVVKAQVATDNRRRNLSKPQKYAAKMSVRSGSRPKWIRVQDRAGNYSKWKKLL
jgi:outer membrane protein assembly factor BamB